MLALLLSRFATLRSVLRVRTELARDGICGEQFRRRVKNMGIEEVLTAPPSPWQTPFAERLVASLRRECRERVIVLAQVADSPVAGVAERRRQFYWLVAVTFATGKSIFPAPPPTSTLM